MEMAVKYEANETFQLVNIN